MCCDVRVTIVAKLVVPPREPYSDVEILLPAVLLLGLILGLPIDSQG